MTTENISKVDQIQAELTAAQEKLTTAQAEAATRVQEIMSVSPVDFVALSAASAPVASAQAAIDRLTRTLADAKAADAWESLDAIRKPIRDAIRDLLIDNAPTVSLVRANGRIEIEEDGSVSVSIRPQFSQADMDSLEDLIAQAVDVNGFTARGLRDISFSVEVSDKVVSDRPTSQTSAATRVTSAATPKSDGSQARSGNLVYNFNGAELGPKAFLQAVEESGSEVVAAHQKAFDTALRGTGNGLSNLAKTVAGKLGVPSATK